MGVMRQHSTPPSVLFFAFVAASILVGLGVGASHLGPRAGYAAILVCSLAGLGLLIWISERERTAARQSACPCAPSSDRGA